MAAPEGAHIVTSPVRQPRSHSDPIVTKFVVRPHYNLSLFPGPMFLPRLLGWRRLGGALRLCLRLRRHTHLTRPHARVVGEALSVSFIRAIARARAAPPLSAAPRSLPPTAASASLAAATATACWPLYPRGVCRGCGCQGQGPRQTRRPGVREVRHGHFAQARQCFSRHAAHQPIQACSSVLAELRARDSLRLLMMPRRIKQRLGKPALPPSNRPSSSLPPLFSSSLQTKTSERECETAVRKRLVRTIACDVLP